MGDNNEHIDVDSDEFESAPKALRDAYKQLQKKFGEVVKERDGFRNRVNESALADVLTGFKNPARVRKDLLNDGIDPLDTEAVQGWISEYGDDYARGDSTPSAETTADPTGDLAAGYQRLNTTGLRKPSDQSLLDAINSLPDDLPADQMAARLRELGA